MENKNSSEVSKQLNIKFGEAEKSKEKGKEFFEIHLHNDLIFRRANGAVNNKNEFLVELVNPEKKYQEMRTDFQGIVIS